MHRPPLLPAAILALMLSVADADSQARGSQIDQGVEQIVIAAENICGQLTSSGSQSQMEIEGKAEAELESLAKKLLDIGIDGAGSLSRGQYSGVLREQLSDEIRDNRRCRESIFNAMFAIVFGAAPETALDETQQEALQGRVRPHGLDILGPEIREFSLQIGESIRLLDDTYMLTLSGVSYGRAELAWSRLAGEFESGITRLEQGSVGHFYHCAITPYSQIDGGVDFVSFLMNCEKE